ncbi:MerR family transcriptional regulator [Pseudobacteroides cellulosolvens]|uniref:Transcriptional regulator, MerR family n=1 Tax=Pseudobacteroides cellulosolvens ATCC 35603 = DSM 2933 TaxID=398512 RepID=A0A0L6JHS7_9FIRM|nr:MerR family transcriptional regulator [Pseudobacteroides cellulosolvens]KNY25255.1 transcriptional regulator, MerR family [Pseudobacteroides cellulosolvens ATCC 35603 = DSM 2933]
MKINEVVKITGLTKKAIYYYEAENLITPEKMPDNNYREFSDDDVKRLVQISALRRLDISIQAIRDILDNPLKAESALKSQISAMSAKINAMTKSREILVNFVDKLKSGTINSIYEELKFINETLPSYQMELKGFMQRELERIFPGTFGKLMYIQIGEFLDEPLDSLEKINSWNELVKLLDSADEIENSKEFDNFVNQLYGERINKYEQKFKDDVDQILHDKDSFNKDAMEQVNHAYKELLDNPDKIQSIKKLYQYLAPYKDMLKQIDIYLPVLSSRFKQIVEMSKVINENDTGLDKELLDKFTDKVLGP